MFRERVRMQSATALPPMVGGEQTGLCHPGLCHPKQLCPRQVCPPKSPRLPSTPTLSHDAPRGAGTRRAASTGSATCSVPMRHCHGSHRPWGSEAGTQAQETGVQAPRARHKEPPFNVLLSPPPPLSLNVGEADGASTHHLLRCSALRQGMAETKITPIPQEEHSDLLKVTELIKRQNRDLNPCLCTRTHFSPPALPPGPLKPMAKWGDGVGGGWFDSRF